MKAKPPSFKELLAKILSKEELKEAITSYDVLGTIARINIPESLRKYEKKIGKALLQSSPQVRTVVRKDFHHGGEFRLQKSVHVAGENTKIAELVENAVRLSFNIDETYYSVRYGNERARIASMINLNERVLVMFSGIAPFVCVIAKHAKPLEVIGVEKNPAAHTAAVENIKKNKLENAKVLLGDVREVVPTLGLFDRIIMPLPQTAREFLALAGKASRSGARIHCYSFAHENELKMQEEEVLKTLKSYKPKVEKIMLCGSYSPGVSRYCFDIKLA